MTLDGSDRHLSDRVQSSRCRVDSGIRPDLLIYSIKSQLQAWFPELDLRVSGVPWGPVVKEKPLMAQVDDEKPLMAPVEDKKSLMAPAINESFSGSPYRVEIGLESFRVKAAVGCDRFEVECHWVLSAWAQPEQVEAFWGFGLRLSLKLASEGIGPAGALLPPDAIVCQTQQAAVPHFKLQWRQVSYLSLSQTASPSADLDCGTVEVFLGHAPEGVRPALEQYEKVFHEQ